MNQNTKACIDELKQIVMQLHRSAANLDAIIMDIESELEGRPDTHVSERNMFLACQIDYRMTHKDKAYGDIDKKELNAWNKLIEAINK